MLHVAHAFDTTEHFGFVAAAAAQNDHGAAVVFAWSPHPVAVVLADGLRQSVSRAIKINRRRLTPVVGEYPGARALLRRQAVINASKSLHQLRRATLIANTL